MTLRARLVAFMVIAATATTLTACAGGETSSGTSSGASTQATQAAQEPQDELQLSPEVEAKDLAADYLNFYTHATDTAPPACEGVELGQRTDDDMDGRGFDIPDAVVIQAGDEFGDRFAGDFYVEARVIMGDSAPVIDVVVSADGSCIEHAYR